MTDWGAFTVVQLKEELKKRDLPTKGLKIDLVGRMTQWEQDQGTAQQEKAGGAAAGVEETEEQEDVPALPVGEPPEQDATRKAPSRRGAAGKKAAEKAKKLEEENTPAPEEKNSDVEAAPQANIEEPAPPKNDGRSKQGKRKALEVEEDGTEEQAATSSVAAKKAKLDPTPVEQELEEKRDEAPKPNGSSKVTSAANAKTSEPRASPVKSAVKETERVASPEENAPQSSTVESQPGATTGETSASPVKAAVKAKETNALPKKSIPQSSSLDPQPSAKNSEQPASPVKAPVKATETTASPKKSTPQFSGVDSQPSKGKSSVPKEVSTRAEAAPAEKKPASPTKSHVKSQPVAETSSSNEKPNGAEIHNENGGSTLLIRNFKRPLTLQQVNDLLAESGDVEQFWMDKIKSHCYVTFKTASQAEAAAAQCNGLQFPPITGQALACEFVSRSDADEAIKRTEAEQARRTSSLSLFPDSRYGSRSSFSSVNSTPITGPHSASPTLSFLPPVPVIDPEYKPPPLPEDARPNDSNFRKTTADPVIYYRPLTEEEVEARRSVPKPVKPAAARPPFPPRNNNFQPPIPIDRRRDFPNDRFPRRGDDTRDGFPNSDRRPRDFRSNPRDSPAFIPNRFRNTYAPSGRIRSPDNWRPSAPSSSARRSSRSPDYDRGKGYGRNWDRSRSRSRSRSPVRGGARSDTYRGGRDRGGDHYRGGGSRH
ncbi:uncharacterized protein EV422DRAFT_547259 [Fimicolochytrium jonesii]|uniref:uncharacterized protein n=1 Tax=Fimicolochytrium jonesii TaxID=1396493 RepID=UPI0022FE8629|nr:uncharacterized protein EV422DRAFT_547259 [Fimicolochytrium jonesii]KAI8816080.1 hypothetical protein EV422DRAFT_547259 [Fimicolochytrium jonesii]